MGQSGSSFGLELPAKGISARKRGVNVGSIVWFGTGFGVLGLNLELRL